MAADLKAAAGFKALAEKKAAEEPKITFSSITPVKAASGTKVDKGVRSPLKLASVFKATPEKIAADRVAASVNSRVTYDAECESLKEEYASKDSAMRHVVATRETAHRRAVTEFRTSYARLSIEEKSFVPDVEMGCHWASRSWKFSKQLLDTVNSLAADLKKAVNDRAVVGERYKLKKLKLLEVARLAWICDDVADPPLNSCLL